jgi:hypothetical protein
MTFASEHEAFVMGFDAGQREILALRGTRE